VWYGVVWVRGVQVLEWATGEEWSEANLRDDTRLLEARAACGTPKCANPPLTPSF